MGTHEFQSGPTRVAVSFTKYRALKVPPCQCVDPRESVAGSVCGRNSSSVDANGDFPWVPPTLSCLEYGVNTHTQDPSCMGDSKNSSGGDNDTLKMQQRHLNDTMRRRRRWFHGIHSMVVDALQRPHEVDCRRMWGSPAAQESLPQFHDGAEQPGIPPQGGGIHIGTQLLHHFDIGLDGNGLTVTLNRQNGWSIGNSGILLLQHNEMLKGLGGHKVRGFQRNVDIGPVHVAEWREEGKVVVIVEYEGLLRWTRACG